MMKKLLLMLFSIAFIAGCANSVTNTQSATTESTGKKYITVENIGVDDLLRRINAKEDFAFIVTRSKECGPCKGMDELLETFESEGSIVYRIDVDTLTEEQKQKLTDKLKDHNYTEHRLDGYPSFYYYSKKKGIYLRPSEGGRLGKKGILRQRFPRSKINN